MTSRRIIYSRGFPYGAPLVMIRGGGTKISGVRGYLHERGFRWNGQRHAWETYMHKSDFRSVLCVLREAYGADVMPKADLDPNYVIDLIDLDTDESEEAE